MKRVFIAIDFDHHIKNYLHQIQQVIINHSHCGNFTNKSNFHLTLKFIGEIEIDLINRIQKCIDEVTLNNSDFQLYFHKLGQFPRKNKAIIWIGLKPSNKLNKLFLDLELELEKIGVTREDRNYTPHITLARQIDLNSDFNSLAQKVEMEALPINVDKVSLMESHRVDGELKYTPIYIKELSNTCTHNV